MSMGRKDLEAKNKTDLAVVDVASSSCDTETQRPVVEWEWHACRAPIVVGRSRISAAIVSAHPR